MLSISSVNSERLFPIVKGGKYGFMDAAGHVRLKPQFNGASTFSEGLARVCVGEKWGFINASGDMAIAPIFDSCLEFSEGLAVVTLQDKQGFINRSGNLAIVPTFYRCDSFQGGLARVQQSMVSKPVFIDMRGQIVLDRHDYLLSEFREGLINCSQGGRWGYIDREGSFVIPPKYIYARPFFEGLAAVCPNNEEQFVFIDTQGQAVINTPFNGADIRFSEGLCAVWSELGGYGHTDRKGRLVIQHSFYFADHFTEGMAIVSPKNSSSYGFIDQTGALVVGPRFTVAEGFEGGLASVIIGDVFEQYLYGYIDKTGAYVWEPSR